MKSLRVILTKPGLLALGAALALTPAFGDPADPKSGSPNPNLSGTPGTGPAAAALYTREWRVAPNLIPPAPTGGAANSANGVVDDGGAAKKWLIAHGIAFNGQAAAVYVMNGSRLVVRNTQDQLGLVDALVTGRPAPKAAVQRGADPAPPLAAATPGDPVIPKLELQEATPAEAFKTITAATGIRIFYTPGKVQAKITLSLTNVPASEALAYVTSLASLKFTRGKDGVHVTPL